MFRFWLNCIYKNCLNIPIKSVLLTCISTILEHISRSEIVRVKRYAIHILIAITNFLSRDWATLYTQQYCFRMHFILRKLILCQILQFPFIKFVFLFYFVWSTKVFNVIYLFLYGSLSIMTLYLSTIHIYI